MGINVSDDLRAKIHKKVEKYIKKDKSVLTFSYQILDICYKNGKKIIIKVKVLKSYGVNRQDKGKMIEVIILGICPLVPSVIEICARTNELFVPEKEDKIYCLPANLQKGKTEDVELKVIVRG